MADFHIHSTFSDGKLSIPELIDLYGAQGFGAIAITDHVGEEKSIIGRAAGHLGLSLTRATFPLYMEILKSEAERAWDEYQMVVIPGVELSKNSISNRRSAHILALGINDYISADGGISEITSAIRNMGALAVAAHPVSSGKIEKQTFHLWDHREELRQCFDAWEVASGSIWFEEVAESGLPLIASSDFHSLKHMSSWKTVLDCNLNCEAILRDIKLQNLSYRFYRQPEESHAPYRNSGVQSLEHRGWSDLFGDAPSPVAG